MAWLEILNGPLRGQVFALTGDGPWRIGSAADCELVLSGPGVEDQHARLACDGQTYQLEPEAGCHLDGEWCADAAPLGDQAIVELGATLCRFRLSRAGGGLGLSPAQLYAMATDEVCRDGRVERWEQDVLTRLAHSLALDEERARALLERSMRRYERRELGVERRFDPRALYLRAQASALHPPTEEGSRLLRALVPLFELRPAEAHRADDEVEQDGWREAEDRLVVQLQPHPGTVSFVRGVSWRRHPVEQLPLTVAWDFQTGTPLLRYQVDRSEGMRRIVAYGHGDAIKAVHLRVMGPRSHAQPSRQEMIGLLGKLPEAGRSRIRRLAVSDGPDPNETFWMVKFGRGETLWSLNREMLILHRPRGGFPAPELLLAELDAAWPLLETAGPFESRRMLRPPRQP